MVHALLDQRLAIDFITLKRACPKGIYVSPVPGSLALWTGVVFVRKGPYANAVLRFDISFPDDYPERPPIVVLLTDVFHPLVAPLTTYTYTSKERGVDSSSAADEEILPPGGVSLGHGFPEWYTSQAIDGRLPHIIEVLQYLRVIFDTNELIDSIPLEGAANPGAWHAWQSYRKRPSSMNVSPARKSLDVDDAARARSMSPNKQQPGGARRPGEWNWTGVWQDRVKKAVRASVAETTLYGGDGSKVIDFAQISEEAYAQLEPVKAARALDQDDGEASMLASDD